MGDDNSLSAAGELWRTLLIVWVTVMALMFAFAVTWSQGATTSLRIFGYGIPLLTAVLALRGVRETLRHKQIADDHAHWWDQTKWAFDLVMSLHAGPADLEMAVRTLTRQTNMLGLPDSDLHVALEMAERAVTRARSLGTTPPTPYDESTERM